MKRWWATNWWTPRHPDMTKCICPSFIWNLVDKSEICRCTNPHTCFWALVIDSVCRGWFHEIWVPFCFSRFQHLFFSYEFMWSIWVKSNSWLFLDFHSHLVICTVIFFTLLSHPSIYLYLYIYPLYFWQILLEFHEQITWNDDRNSNYNST